MDFLEAARGLLPVRRTVRIGVTGLARAGKTALLTSVAANLLAAGGGAAAAPALRRAYRPCAGEAVWQARRHSARTAKAALGKIRERTTEAKIHQVRAQTLRPGSNAVCAQAATRA